MSRIILLTKLANQFYTKAVAAQNLQLQQYFDHMIRSMLGLVRGLDASVKHLLSLPKYRQSTGLQSMTQQIPQLTTALTGLSPQDPAQGLDSVENILNDLSFFTSAGNAGTGQDIATMANEGGYTPPAYYVSTMSKMVDQMKERLLKQTPSFNPNALYV